VESNITIDAAQLQKAAAHLRATLFEFSKVIEKFDSGAAALMQQNENFITRFESAVENMHRAVERMEKS
jgi:exonuclease VII small subunit